VTMPVVVERHQQHAAGRVIACHRLWVSHRILGPSARNQSLAESQARSTAGVRNPRLGGAIGQVEQHADAEQDRGIASARYCICQPLRPRRPSRHEEPGRDRGTGGHRDRQSDEEAGDDAGVDGSSGTSR